jgi:hypothetical protein
MLVKHVLILWGVAAESNTGAAMDNVLANDRHRKSTGRGGTGKQTVSPTIFPADTTREVIE